jgi:opacity protein-like surface antigen
MKKALLVVLAAMLLISAAVVADPVIKISGVIALRNEEGV